jgi:hypothetical protein
MDQALATVLLLLIAALGAIFSAIMVVRATIAAAQEPSKLTMLLRVFPGFVASVIYILAIVSVFIYIPFTSNYAFLLLVLAYTIVAAGYRPPAK